MDGSKPYDASINGLISIEPDGWARFFAALVGIPFGPYEEVDTDLSVTAQSDKVFLINGAAPTLLHLEFESSHRLGIPRDLMRYNTLIDHRHDLPVQSVLILLHRRAQATDLTGMYQRVGPNQAMIHQFVYRVERVWKHSIDDWLNAGLGVAPLAVLTDEAASDLEGALVRLKDHVVAKNPAPTIRDMVFNATSFLSGLRYHESDVFPLLRRLNMLMEESSVYQAIKKEGIQEGRQEGIQEGLQLGTHQTLQHTITKLGTQRFGKPTTAVAEQLRSIVEIRRLEEISDRILTATGWDDLMQSSS